MAMPSVSASWNGSRTGADGGMANAPHAEATQRHATCRKVMPTRFHEIASTLPTKSRLALQFQRIRQAEATVRPRGRHTLR